RQRRADARAHFRSVRDDEDRAVRLDAEVDTWMERGGVGFRVEDCRRRSGTLREQIVRHQPRRDNERTGRHDAVEELTTAEREVLDDHHARSFAAVWIAARMR